MISMQGFQCFYNYKDHCIYILEQCIVRIQYIPHSQGVKSTAGYSPAKTGSAAIKKYVFSILIFFRILRFRDSAVLSTN